MMAYTKEQRLINSVSGNTKAQRNIKKNLNLTGSFVIPNKSGDHMRSIKRDAPVQDYDLVNKKYVDDNVGGGNIYASKVVAANDSIDKTSADYVCDGTDDEVQINAAIDALATTGGRVLLLEGTYQVGSDYIKLDQDNVTLEGQGNGTLINGDGSPLILIYITENGCRVQNLRLNSNRSTLYSTGIYCYGADYITIENVRADDAYYGVGFYNANYCLVMNCSLVDCAYCIYESTSGTKNWNVYQGNVLKDAFYGIHSYGSYVTIAGNTCDSCSIGFRIAGTSSACTGNVCQDFASYGIQVQNSDVACNGNALYGSSGGSGVSITGDHASVLGNSIRACDNYAIRMAYADGCTIGNNMIYDIDDKDAISGSHTDYATITNNSIGNVKYDGISIDNCNYITIVGNNISNPGQQTDNTFDGISMATCDYCVVNDNTVTNDTAVDQKYGINEQNTCDYNLFDGNILTNAQTANLNVNGANSVTGDNIAP